MSIVFAYLIAFILYLKVSICAEKKCGSSNYSLNDKMTLSVENPLDAGNELNRAIVVAIHVK